MTDLQQRIQRLEDIEAIKQLKARYLHACDRKLVDQIRECFAEGEVVIDYGPVGRFTNREQLIEVFTAMAVNSSVIDAHHAQNAQIHWRSENSASGIWDLYFYQINPDSNAIMQICGFYRDDYEKQSGQWKIVESLFHPTSTVAGTYEDQSFRILSAGTTPSF